jgi:hypothetical protein
MSQGPTETNPATTIDITPTWEGLLSVMLAVFENGDAAGRKEVYSELRRMAQVADLYVVANTEEPEEDSP